MRTTVLRLERRIQEEHANALVQLQSMHEGLVGSLLEAARAAGYLGSDPLSALSHLAAPSPELARFEGLVQALWEGFFAGFRADEQQFEAARFREAAAAIEQRLAALPAGQAPDADLALAMLETLVGFWDERQSGLADRVDQLIGELSSSQQRLGSADLQVAYQEDETSNAAALIATALAEMGERVSANDRLADLLGILIKRWRGELRRRADELSELKQRHHASEDVHQRFLATLAGAAGGQVPADTQLPAALARVADEVAGLVRGVREAETRERELQAELAGLRAEAKHHQEELAARDERLARYELESFAGGGDEDRRLQLYRAAFAKLKHGENADTELAEVQELERVLTPSVAEEDQARRLLDSQLGELVRTLQELRRINPVGDDPRRFRPRLLASSPYRLKTLSGVIQASRDAARDLLGYVAMARWAQGLTGLVKDFARLRKVFREMVSLVGDCRDRLGGPPPASMTIPLDSAEGIGALPAVLAVDVQALARAKGVSRVAPDVVELLEASVELFHGVLERARGDRIERVEPPRRESATKAMARLADELLQLAGLMDQAFAEAREHGWRLSPEEEALLAADRILVLGLRSLDGACDILAVLPGTPGAEFTRPPGARTSGRVLLDRLQTCVRERCEWLEDLGRYRVEPR